MTTKGSARSHQGSGSESERLIIRILERMGKPVMSTALVKLTYLADYMYYQHYGRTITGFRYMWDHHGPNAVGHAIINEAERMANTSIIHLRRIPNIYGTFTSEFVVDTPRCTQMDPTVEHVLDSVIGVYGKMSLQKLVAASKRTEPFKRIKQYEPIEMDRVAPAVVGDPIDWEAYVREVEVGT